MIYSVQKSSSIHGKRITIIHNITWMLIFRVTHRLLITRRKQAKKPTNTNSLVSDRLSRLSKYQISIKIRIDHIDPSTSIWGWHVDLIYHKHRSKRYIYLSRLYYTTVHTTHTALTAGWSGSIPTVRPCTYQSTCIWHLTSISHHHLYTQYSTYINQPTTTVSKQAANDPRRRRPMTILPLVHPNLFINSAIQLSTRH